MNPSPPLRQSDLIEKGNYQKGDVEIPISYKQSPTSHKVAFVFAALLLVGAFALGGSSAYFALKTGFLLKTWVMIGGSATSLVASIALFILGKNKAILKPENLSSSSNVDQINHFKAIEFINDYNSFSISPDKVDDSTIVKFNNLTIPEMNEIIKELNTRDVATISQIIHYLVNYSMPSLTAVTEIIKSDLVEAIADKYFKENTRYELETLLKEYPANGNSKLKAALLKTLERFDPEPEPDLIFQDGLTAKTFISKYNQKIVPVDAFERLKLEEMNAIVAELNNKSSCDLTNIIGNLVSYSMPQLIQVKVEIDPTIVDIIVDEYYSSTKNKKNDRDVLINNYPENGNLQLKNAFKKKAPRT